MKTLYIDTSSSYLYAGIVCDNELLEEVKENLGQDLSRVALPKIVDMFNTFTNRNMKAIAELELRQAQFDWLKYQLLKNTDNSISISLNDSCFLEKGKTPIQKAVPGKYPLVVTAIERKSNDTFQFDKPSVCVPLVSYSYSACSVGFKPCVP